MNLSRIPRMLVRHRRGLLMAGSFIASGMSFIKIWRSRHAIDTILDETRERRKSEDKKVRREANWEATKRIAPIVALPTLGMVGSVVMGATAHKLANAEIAHACETIDSMSRIITSETTPETPIEEINARNIMESERSSIPIDKYFLRATGEVFCLPRNWRTYGGVDEVNDEIERIVQSSDLGTISLGQIRHLIKPDAEPIGTDDVIVWSCKSIHDMTPYISVSLPEDTHGEGELMWEIRINGQMDIDYDSACWA